MNRRSIFLGLIGAAIPAAATAQSSMAEDAVVIHRLVRAPVRKTFFIDIGDRQPIGDRVMAFA